jgi:hypothetical protein
MKDLWKFRNRLTNADSGEYAVLKGQYENGLFADMPVPCSRKFETKNHQGKCECRKLNN